MPDPPVPDPPLRPDNRDYLRKQAKKLLRQARSGDSAALARLAAIVDVSSFDSISLAQAQLVIAREAGFASWPRMLDELYWRADVRSKHRLGSATSLKPGETMNTNDSLKLGHIDQIGLSCTDLDEAQRFYCGVLGLRPAGEVPGVMKFFDCDGVNIIMFKSDSVPPNSTLYFRVPGEAGLIEQKVNLLKAKGVKVESDAHLIARNWNGRDVWMAFFRDPFGNLLGLKSDVPVK